MEASSLRILHISDLHARSSAGVSKERVEQVERDAPFRKRVLGQR